MDRLVIGILAHVDAGKTTLSEAMLYRCGSLRTLGRVDHQTAFLDHEDLERQRGITIFSKQAVLTLEDLELILLDTPGHVDFSGEMERTLGVLDYAILVVSGPDGLQGHTRTLWRLLERYQIPTFLFVNKMDLAGADRAACMAELKGLHEGCVDFSRTDREQLLEDVAVCDEALLGRYLERGSLEDEEIGALVARRVLFPCCFGSALKLEGVDAFLHIIRRIACRKHYPDGFGARVYKVARDAQGTRLTYLKLTGGTLRVKQLLTNRRPDVPPGKTWEEKVDQIRIYSGARYRTLEAAEAGGVYAVTGLSRTFPGEGLGIEGTGAPPVLEPVLSYRVELPEGCDAHSVLGKFRELEEEDPQLRVDWNGQLQEIHIRLMGEIQLEVLAARIRTRFGLEVGFGAGGVVYRETIAAPVEGVGHFEPLRHYAEVHLLLEPGERGSGLVFDSACSEDVLDRSWQRLILTHLEERTHRGVLVGAPVTDMKITLVAGRGHEKHTEGGDFREATYRAVRQGLMCARSVLLEPWYDFTLELPSESVGRAMMDIQQMGGDVAHVGHMGKESVLSGSGPVAGLRGYAVQVAAYTRGEGRLSCIPGGYAPCRDQASVVASAGYDPERDLEQTPDSVFCSHGAGFAVKWNRVREYMHVESGRAKEEAAAQGGGTDLPSRRAASEVGALELDRELREIYERTYGPVKPRAFQPPPPSPPGEVPRAAVRTARSEPGREEYLLVDGYNIIHAWEELAETAKENLDAARQLLMDLMSNYQAQRGCTVILVFDAYRVPRGTGEVVSYHNIHVVYTKEAETADAYIERVTYELGKRHRVRVATSDAVEQLIILGHNALRVSARALRAEVEQVNGEIAAILARNNRPDRSGPVRSAMERAEERKKTK